MKYYSGVFMCEDLHQCDLNPGQGLVRTWGLPTTKQECCLADLSVGLRGLVSSLVYLLTRQRENALQS